MVLDDYVNTYYHNDKEEAMKRDLEKEISEIREEIQELKRMQSSHSAAGEGDMDSLARFYGKCPQETPRFLESLKEKGKKPPGWGMDLAREALQKGCTEGIVKLDGIFRSSGDEGHMWNLEKSAADLLQVDDGVAEKVLSALGNRVRIRILKAILRSPCTANQLVEKLGMNTTGKAYHHLNLLENADLIHKDEAGLYRFRGHRVSGFFAALFAVENTVDDRYTSGNIDALPAGADG
jgi:DNA-binding transcriptional ArsR family regulator